jgi:hypothetical protein
VGFETDGDSSMRSNAKSNTKKKPGKKVASDVSHSDLGKKIVPDKGAEPKPARKDKPDKTLSPGVIETEGDMFDETDAECCNELYTLRYDINERGVGKLLLPPSLSTLLQSDRVAISPAARGLFIRSL